MKINNLIIVNYKSCRCVEIDLLADYPNIFIGVNDSGKSSILEAVGLLLDEKYKFNFVKEDKIKKDLSNNPLSVDEFMNIFDRKGLTPPNYYDKCTYVFGNFEVEKDDIDDKNIEGISSLFLWTVEKNNNNRVWLCKILDDETKLSRYQILTFIGESDKQEYFNEKATALSKLIKEKGITKEEIENENKKGRYTTIELVRAIMNKIDLTPTWVDYKFDKSIFPTFRYLDWNISLEQLTQFTKDTMADKIKPEIDATKHFANEQRLSAQKKLNEGLEIISELFSKDVPVISKIKANIFFNIEPKITDFVLNKTNCDGDIHIESQGEGVKRQIWFSLIKWNALNAIDLAKKNKRFFWCFDEPETHLFPAAQRDFYKIIKETTTSNVQTVISTHSTIFVDKSKIIEINKVDLVKGYSNISKCSSIEDVYINLNLRNSDFLFYDKFLIVEGDTEEVLIKKFYAIISKSSLSNDNIQLISLGGKEKVVQNSKILESILSEFKKPKDSIVYVFDNDASFCLTKEEIKRYNPCFLGSQDIEDSINSNVWKSIIDDNVEEGLRLSLEEINELKLQIPNNKAISANQKFYPKLKRLLTNKLIETGRDDYYLVDQWLPAKGKESGELISGYIKTIDQIDLRLKETLEKLMI